MGIHSKAPTKAYDEGWERIFGKRTATAISQYLFEQVDKITVKRNQENVKNAQCKHCLDGIKTFWIGYNGRDKQEPCPSCNKTYIQQPELVAMIQERLSGDFLR